MMGRVASKGMSYRPIARRRAPDRPSRGRARSPSFRALPRLNGARRYGTDSGCIFVSPRVPESEHAIVLAAFEAHAVSGYGRSVVIDGDAYSESSFSTPRGEIRLVTSHEFGDSYAYYDWEEKP